MKIASVLLKKSSGAMTRIGPKHQVTIPKEIFGELGLEVGDYLEVRTRTDTITMVPKKLIPKDQAWFYAPEWQKKEMEADEDIARGDVDGPFDSSKDLGRYLRSLKKKSP